MYTGKHVRLRPLQPAFIMASTGEAVTYRELDTRANRLAHLFRKCSIPSFGIAEFAVNVCSSDNNKNTNKMDGCCELSRVFLMRRENSPENQKSKL